ncbi:hypothetical protein CPC735_049200 [Coccidioides posadasii C735 delta SOWgp]|uniref:Uncharacterized protein n=1 Tax=Coccidioides posadasii (strain C735) TaxID=222929 RepID=C5PG97_COCP7|nr:hypothetical protein CPC735_049200 [Coccidioides posadasii C735 delta SOWgp]EER23550.1 hypothetical protein CPC735_049200 [Coccidioides posadasii C735 delta SOWgp]|eukprot:XP_003065695.1 hypothetical protein CPC735_049200 [Coccidioides posadasii C735 delta SOWgp]
MSLAASSATAVCRSACRSQFRLPVWTRTDASSNPNDAYTSPYKAKRTWPPDVSKLSPKQQFRLERKYRRRAKLKWARPTWKKWTKLVQWTLIGFVLVYSLFFMELKDGGNNPFASVFITFFFFFFFFPLSIFIPINSCQGFWSRNADYIVFSCENIRGNFSPSCYGRIHAAPCESPPVPIPQGTPMKINKDEGLELDTYLSGVVQ